MIPILIDHIGRHGGFGARDAYKLLYQCCLGPSHAAGDSELARRYFVEEFERTMPDDSISLIESISPDDQVVRINIAPYKFRGLEPDILFKAFIESAEIHKPDKTEFIRNWKNLVEKNELAKIGLDVNDMKEIDKIAREKDYPPLHHSRGYARKNSPAYRVALLDILLKYLPDLRCDLQSIS